MKASAVRSTAIKAMLVSIFVAVSPAAFAQVNYGDYSGTGVNFLDVTETTQTPADPAALWGTPVFNGAGNGLVFTPPAFESVCSAGSSDITASLLTMTIIAQPGSTIFSFGMTEAGDVTLTTFPPFGDPSTNASVSMGGFLTVIEDSSGPIAPVVIPFAGTFLPADTFSLPGDFGVSTWTGSVTVDVAAQVPNATRAILQLNDTLDANCGDGTTDGTIRKTPAVTVSVGVNPPARFTVGKSFSDGNTADVTVELTCTSGDVNADDATASTTDPADFIISGFGPGTTCTAIENPVPPGYSNATGELCTNQLIVEGEETTCTLVNVKSQNAVQVPTLPEWSMIFLSFLLALVAYSGVRRKLR